MLSLLILVPVLLLTFSALGIAILRQVRPSIGYSWLWAVLASLITWGLILALRWQLPLGLSIGQWEPFGQISQMLSLQLDTVTWPYALALSALLVAVLLTDSARLQRDAGPMTWIFSLLITGFGILAILSDRPIVLILTWMVIDLAELIGVFSTQAGRLMSQPVVIMFSVRVAGTLMVIMALLFSSALGIEFTLNPIPPQVGAIMLLAAGLRLGVLPLNLPFTREVYAWRGLGNLLRLVGPASSLVVLGHMPPDAVPAAWQPAFLFFAALASIYGGAMWLASDPASLGRPYWIIALASLAITSVVQGVPQASVAWGMALLLAGSVHFLYSAQNRAVLLIPLFAILGITGLPFTPAAQGWLGLIGSGFDFYSLLFLLTVLMLCLGFLRRSMVPQEELYSMERWIHTVYPAGLIFLILTQWLIVLANGPEAFSLGVWWASVSVTLVAVVVGLLIFSKRAVLLSLSARTSWLLAFGQAVGGSLATFFRLNWLYRLLVWGYGMLQNFIGMLTAILEGDGGVLWAMVLLVLLISLLANGGAP